MKVQFYRKFRKSKSRKKKGKNIGKLRNLHQSLAVKELRFKISSSQTYAVLQTRSILLDPLTLTTAKVLTVVGNPIFRNS